MLQISNKGVRLFDDNAVQVHQGNVGNKAVELQLSEVSTKPGANELLRCWGGLIRLVALDKRFSGNQQAKCRRLRPTEAT